MKKNYYYSVVNLPDDSYLYYNSFSNQYLLLDKRLHSLYQESSPIEIQLQEKEFYNILMDNGFLIEDDIDELSIVELKKLSKRFDSVMYHVVINTTLDCNLNCWYCYESKIVDSNIDKVHLDIILKNIECHYRENPYRKLKISFFGGEPFMNFECIYNTLEFARQFAMLNNVELIVDFTTNATLITQSQLHYLSEFTCCFQITLDGYENKHNKVRAYKEGKMGSYADIIRNIYRIHDLIKDVRLWVRINFDKSTLNHFSDILKDLAELDRRKAFIILRKVWQLPNDSINKDVLLDVLQQAMNEGFFIDYYALPHTDLCFAERMNQVLFNYDGGVFKCSTLECFDEENSYGKLLPDGNIQWNMNALAKKTLCPVDSKCSVCKIYPSCLGRCNEKKIKNKGFSCYLDVTNLSLDEFIMYNFKLKMLWES